MVITRELKRRIRQALGTQWRKATAAEVARIALVELALLHLVELGEAGTVADAARLITDAHWQALQTIENLGLPDPSEEAPDRPTKAISAERLAELREAARTPG